MRVQIGGDKGSFSEKLVKLLLNQVTLNVLCTFIIRFKVKNVETAQRQVSGFFLCVYLKLYLFIKILILMKFCYITENLYLIINNLNKIIFTFLLCAFLSLFNLLNVP